MIIMLMVIGFVGLFVIVLVWAIYASSQQKAHRAELAQVLGFIPVEEPDLSILNKIASVHPHFGSPRYSLKNVSRRSFPYGTTYLYDLITSDSESSNLMESAAVAIISPGINLPRFTTYPRLGMGSKLADWANQFIEDLIEAQGFTELDLENFPDFEKIYFLFGEDETAVKALFSTSLIAMLVRETNLSISANGDIISVSRVDFKNRLNPDETAVRKLVDQSLAIYDRLSNPGTG
jgi:hypothetical protein